MSIFFLLNIHDQLIIFLLAEMHHTASDLYIYTNVQ